MQLVVPYVVAPFHRRGLLPDLRHSQGGDVAPNNRLRLEPRASRVSEEYFSESRYKETTSQCSPDTDGCGRFQKIHEIHVRSVQGQAWYHSQMMRARANLLI